MTLMEQIAELRRLGYRTLPAQAKVAHDAVLLAMHRSGFKPKSAIKGGVVMSSITGDIRRATMDMDINAVGTGPAKPLKNGPFVGPVPKSFVYFVVNPLHRICRRTPTCSRRWRRLCLDSS